MKSRPKLGQAMRHRPRTQATTTATLPARVTKGVNQHALDAYIKGLQRGV